MAVVPPVFCTVATIVTGWPTLRRAGLTTIATVRMAGRCTVMGLEATLAPISTVRPLFTSMPLAMTL